MSDALTSLISTVIATPALHARWLNTFSYLEYLGFRKIVKSQGADDLSLATLSHAVEEGRHALRLKKLAIQVGGPHFDCYADHTLLVRDKAEAYIQVLDHSCAKALGIAAGARLTYLYVSWLIEQRALSVYGTYQNLLPHSGEISLKSLLNEEHLHLRQAEDELKGADPSFEQRAPELKDLEAGLYHDYMRALAAELHSAELYQ